MGKIGNNVFVEIFVQRLETGNSWRSLESISNILDTHLHPWRFNEWTNLTNKYGYRNAAGIGTYENKKHRTNKLSYIVSKNEISLCIKISNSQVYDIKLLFDTLPKKHFLVG